MASVVSANLSEQSVLLVGAGRGVESRGGGAKAIPSSLRRWQLKNHEQEHAGETDTCETVVLPAP